jgi:hypothetical protein
VVEVNSAVCSGTARLTIRDNEGAAIGGAGGAAVAYDATKTNPQIEARFNRMRGALTGSSVLVAGTVTVSAPEIFSGDLVQLSHTVAGGTLGHLSLGTITSGTGFVINSSSVTDTSTVLWEIVH